jgi:hypothetical protein
MINKIDKERRHSMNAAPNKTPIYIIQTLALKSIYILKLHV